MIKKMLVVLVAFCFCAGLAFAGNLSLGVRGNMLCPDEIDENELGGGIMAEYDLPYNLSIEAAVDRLNYGDAERVVVAPFAIAGISEELDATNLSLSLKYNVKGLTERLTPYFLGGIGVLINDYSDVEVDIDNSFESHVGAGLNYSLNENWTLATEARYIWSEADSDYGEADLDAFMATTGLKYRF